MYHSDLNIYLLNQTRDCTFFVQRFHYSKNYRVSVYADKKLIITFLRKADILIVNLPAEELPAFMEAYKDYAKKSCRLIFNTDAERRSILLSDIYKDYIYELWPLAMDTQSFCFNYTRLYESLHRDHELWEKQQYLDSVINSTDSLVWFKDKQGAHVKVNDSFCKAVNKTHEQIQDRGHFYIWDITPEDYQAGEFICMESEIEVMEKKERCLFDEQVKIGEQMHYLKTYKTPLFDLDGSVMGTCGVAQDVSQEVFYREASSNKQQEIAKLKHHVYVDDITGGDTYLLFKTKVAAINKAGSICAVNLRDFKTINTICGTRRGDEVLKRTFDILNEIVGKNDIVARVGADSYVLYCLDAPEENCINPYELLVHKLHLLAQKLDTPSLIPYIGIARYNPGDDVEIVYSKACIARNSLKNMPGSICRTYTDSMGNEAEDQRDLEAAFDSALHDGHFELWLQPKFSTTTEEAVGAEALVRWRDKDGSLISPAKFIKLLEYNGRIKDLDEHIYRKVCAYQQRALQKGGKLLPISINLSRVSLFSSSIAKRYTAIAEEYGVDHRLLPIEITESAAIDEEKSAETIQQFRREEFPLYLDDFGAGYSSLATLASSKFETIKLDKSLVDNIGNDLGDKLLKHTIALAKDLQLKVTAEGVEEASQKDFLAGLSVDDIQGYYYSKPIPEEEFWNRYTKEVTISE